jgi:hypothetical protein
VARGEGKRLLEWTLAEAGAAIVEAGLLTREALDRTLVDMQRIADDETVLALMPRMSQVWARKRGSRHAMRHDDVRRPTPVTTWAAGMRRARSAHDSPREDGAR